MYVFHSGFRGAGRFGACQGSGFSVGKVRDGTSPISASACFACSASSALPCQPSLSSRNETPLPFTVLATITVGRSALARAGERVVDRREVVAIDHDRVAAERLHPRGVGVEVPLELGRAALTEPVDVEDRGEVREALVTRVVEPLPDRALRELAVARERPDVVGRREHALACERDPDGDRQTLAERAGGDVDPREHRRRMAFEAASELAERHELVVGDRTGRAEERVDQRRGVALAEDQVIVRGVLRLRPVVAEMAGEQNGHQIGGRQRRRRMAGARGRRAADRVGAQLAREGRVEIEVPARHAVPSTLITKSRPSQRSTAGQKNVNRIGGCLAASSRRYCWASELSNIRVLSALP